MIRKALVGLTVLAGLGMVAAAEKPASAGGFDIQVYRGGRNYAFSYGGHDHGGGYYGARSFYGGHGGYYCPSRRPSAVWHDTSHWDYHPGEYVPHGNHYHYIPGHYDWHQDGHWDVHH